MGSGAFDQVQRYLLDGKAENRQKGVQLLIGEASALFRELSVEDACEKLLAERSKIEESVLSASSAFQRRSGIIALRSIVKGMPSQPYPGEFVRLFSLSILGSLTDRDPIVRVSAAEAAYELLRKLNTQLLQIVFEELFTALSCAVNDKDCRVSLLAREISNLIREQMSGDDDFRLDIAIFMRFVCKTLEPYSSISLPPSELRLVTGSCEESAVVKWVLEWIAHVLDMPSHRLTDHLSELLPALLVLPMESSESMLWKLLQTCRCEFRKTLAEEKDTTVTACILRALMSTIYTAECPLMGQFCFEWICELLQLDNQSPMSGSLAQLYNAILLCALRHVGSPDTRVRVAAQHVNAELMLVVIRAKGGEAGDPLSDILGTVINLLSSQKGYAETHLAALNWITLLHHQYVELVKGCFDNVMRSILELLGDALTEVYTKAVEALCLITKVERLKSLLEGVFFMMRQTSSLLLPRLPIILKQMQVYWEDVAQSDTLLVAVCDTLPDIPDRRFICKCVVTLNNMLLTSVEFSKLRQVLKEGVAVSVRTRTIFVQLSRTWKYNGVSLLALCLLTRSYGLSLALCQYLGEIEPSPSTLVQVDRLAQMLEGPVFSFLRVSMLTPSQCTLLVQTLFGILLLLPQTSLQYKILYNRLKIVPGLSQLERGVCAPAATGEHENRKRDSDNLWDKVHEPLLRDFKQCQEEIAAFERNADLQLGD